MLSKIVKSSLDFCCRASTSPLYYSTDYEFEVYPSGSTFTNCYLLYDEETTIIVDTPEESFNNLIDHEAMENDVISIFITHGHFDHVGDLLRFQNKFDLNTYFMEEEAEKVLEGLRSYTREMPQVTKYIEEGEILETGLGSVEILHIPGHTPGSCGYYFKDDDFIFVGDVLFQGSIGRTDLGGGDFNVLSYSIKQKLYKLPDETLVFSGHGPSTNIGFEKEFNAFVREKF